MLDFMVLSFVIARLMFASDFFRLAGKTSFGLTPSASSASASATSGWNDGSAREPGKFFVSKNSFGDFGQRSASLKLQPIITAPRLLGTPHGLTPGTNC